MYNRYIRNDRGQYDRVPQEEYAAPPPQDGAPPFSTATSDNPGGVGGIVKKLLGKLKLDGIDRGDILLLLLLLFLFADGEDDELLIALGLLLIL